MRSSVASSVVVAASVAGLALFYGCSSETPNNPFLQANAGSAGTPPGSSGSTGMSGNTSGGSGALPTAGANGTAGSGSGVGGSVTVDGTGTGGMSGAGGSSTAGAGGSAAGSGGGDITKVVKGAGCGQDPASVTGTHTIHTMGTKPAGCADSKCGAWAYDREYTVTLPQPYDNTKAYPLVLEGPGCGSDSKAVYPLTIPYPDGLPNAGNTVIRVGLKPPPNDIGHATNPGQGCFDDKEGDDSVDWTFYENLYDLLDTKLCFDHNRVFAAGNSSGAWFSNEIGCKYAGDAKRPIRGIMPNTGGLPTDIPSAMPTCSSKPLSGIWMGESMDTENDFVHNKAAMSRAMMVNGCTGTDIDKATFVDFPAGNSAIACKKVVGCPDLYPIVMCLKDGKEHAGHDDSANPAFSTFVQQFSKGAFITQ
jgi:poly(3-hydroxybutyrate) depolymerase